MLAIQTRESGDVLILDLSGSMQGGPESTKVHEISKTALEKGTRSILLNLKNVDWINSLGLGTLISIYVSTRRQEGKLAICNASDRVQSMLKTAGVIPDVFALYESEQAAIDSF